MARPEGWGRRRPSRRLRRLGSNTELFRRRFEPYRAREQKRESHPDGWLSDMARPEGWGRRRPSRRLRRLGSNTELFRRRFEPYRAREQKRESHPDGWLSDMARPEGFEPPTTWFVARYSIQLSYGRISWRGTGVSQCTHLRDGHYPGLGIFGQDEQRRSGKSKRGITAGSPCPLPFEPAPGGIVQIFPGDFVPAPSMGLAASRPACGGPDSLRTRLPCLASQPRAALSCAARSPGHRFPGSMPLSGSPRRIGRTANCSFEGSNPAMPGNKKRAHKGPVSYCLAEREGFEPSKDVYALTPLAGERFRPLSHLSWRSSLRGGICLCHLYSGTPPRSRGPMILGGGAQVKIPSAQSSSEAVSGTTPSSCSRLILA